MGALEPLALEYMGAGIGDNHDVELIDLRLETEPGLKQTLESFQPDIIGCGGCTIDVYQAKQICAEAKQVLPGILTVVGGHHATIMPDDYVDETIDVIIAGEGVAPFKKVCDCHDTAKSFENIENIYYRKDGKMAFTRKTEHPTLDTLPFPDRALTSHLRDHYNVTFVSGLTSFACIRGSLGCIYRCKFCAVTSMLNRKVYRHSIDRIMAELESIDESYVLWVDDEFLLDPQRAIQLAKEIQRSGIRKHHDIYGRADHIARNPECVEELAKAGLQSIFIGIEAHRDNRLKEMRKGISTSTNEEAIRICHANNVQVRGNFIIPPDFDKDDFQSMAQYARELVIDLPSYSIMTPLPGTQLYEELKDRLITHNYNLFDAAHTVLPTRLPLEEFYQEFGRITAESISFERKMSILKQMDPQLRQKVLYTLGNYFQRLENAYLDYQ
jgi:radical SAM superfamily enzyme YgiQ (UPF0313 family)